jgi:biopolymer transport protein ExbD
MAGAGGDSGAGKQSRAARGVSGRAKSRQVQPGGLMLASMLDILMAILFFLLKNYSSVVTEFQAAKDITLPTSSALAPPMPALQLVVTQKEIILDDKPIAAIVNGDIDKAELYRDGVTIVKLAQALKEQKDRSLYVQQHNDTHSFTGTIVLQADKSLNFNLLKKVIYTAGVSDFVMLKLAVLKRVDDPM